MAVGLIVARLVVIRGLRAYRDEHNNIQSSAQACSLLTLAHIQRSGEGMSTEITSQGSKYTRDQRTEAAVIYAQCGLGSETSKQTGIPEQTISSWTKLDWWDEIIGEVRSANKDQHIAKYEAIQLAAQDQVMIALPKATAQQAATVMGIAQDKSRILQALPNQHQGDNKGMEALAQQFKELAANHRRIEGSVVETIDPSKGQDENVD